MLDLLLRYLNGRNLVVAGLAAASIPFAIGFAKYSRQLYMQTVYPPVRDSSQSADDIKKLLDQRETEKLLAQYRLVSSHIADAKQLGYNVGGLMWRADEAMVNNVPGRRSIAAQMLTEIDMATPRKKVQYIPLMTPAPHDMMTDEDETPAASAAKVTTTAKPKAGKAAKARPKTKRKHRP